MGKRGGFPGNFGGMNFGNIMKEAKKMQADLEKTQSEIASKDFEATAGGGAVKVKVSGAKVIKELFINPEAAKDVEMLQDLVIACVNEALRKVDNEQSEQMGKFNIPGLM